MQQYLCIPDTLVPGDLWEDTCDEPWEALIKTSMVDSWCCLNWWPVGRFEGFFFVFCFLHTVISHLQQVTVTACYLLLSHAALKIFTVRVSLNICWIVCALTQWVNSPLEAAWLTCQMPFQRCSLQIRWWWGHRCHLCPWLWWCRAPSLKASASVLQQLRLGQVPVTSNYVRGKFGVTFIQNKNKDNKGLKCKDRLSCSLAQDLSSTAAV